LVDNNLPPALARALDALSANKFSDLEQVIALRDKFPQDASDVTWIQALGQEGDWFILSADQFRKHGDRIATERTDCVLPQQVMVLSAVLGKVRAPAPLVATHRGTGRTLAGRRGVPSPLEAECRQTEVRANSILTFRWIAAQQ